MVVLIATSVDNTHIRLEVVSGRHKTENDVMDIVFIEELSVITTIGVYDWEQTIQQKLVFDIEWAGITVKRRAVMMSMTA